MPFFLIIPEGYRFDLLLFLVFRFGIQFVPWSSSFTFALLLFGCVSLLVSWMKIWAGLRAANIVVVWWRCIFLETIVWQLVHFLWNSQCQITAHLSWGCCIWFLFDFSFYGLEIVVRGSRWIFVMLKSNGLIHTLMRSMLSLWGICRNNLWFCYSFCFFSYIFLLSGLSFGLSMSW